MDPLKGVLLETKTEAKGTYAVVRSTTALLGGMEYLPVIARRASVIAPIKPYMSPAEWVTVAFGYSTNQSVRHSQTFSSPPMGWPQTSRGHGFASIHFPQDSYWFS